MQTDTSQLERIIDRATRFTLVGHFNPDGDSVGSVTALYHYLKARGKQAGIILPSPYQESMAFLEPDDPSDRIVIHEADPARSLAMVASAEVVFCLDFNRLSRTEYLEEAILGSPATRVLIDHHPASETEKFDLAYSETMVSSTCELLYRLLMSLPDVDGDASKLPLRCAESLYVGMMTDTNNFSNSVFPGTFEMASKLIARGVDKDGLQDKVLCCYSVARTRLMGHLIKDSMQIVARHKAAYMLLSNAEKKAYEFKSGDSEGFVNLPLAIRDVCISALFTENNDGTYIRVSLRSKGTLDVNSLARRFFNGGGHRNASGGRLYMPLGQVPAYFEKALDEFFGEEKFS